MRKFDEKNIASCYRLSPIAEKLRKGLDIPLKRFPIMLKNYVFLIDEDSQNIIFLLPLNDLNKANKDLKEIVLNDVKNNIKNCGLKIKEEKLLLQDKYKIGVVMAQSYIISA